MTVTTALSFLPSMIIFLGMVVILTLTLAADAQDKATKRKIVEDKAFFFDDAYYIVIRKR